VLVTFDVSTMIEHFLASAADQRHRPASFSFLQSCGLAR
jgi:hypothetical protein